MQSNFRNPEQNELGEQSAGIQGEAILQNIFLLKEKKILGSPGDFTVSTGKGARATYSESIVGRDDLVHQSCCKKKPLRGYWSLQNRV